MHTDWSTYIQGIGTLHFSRSLRFSDLFKEKYMRAKPVGTHQIVS